MKVSYLHIKTNSAMESKEHIGLWYFDETGSIAGSVVILYSSPDMKYFLWYCHLRGVKFPPNLPVEREKHWIIARDGNRNVIYCNGIQVVDDTVSDAMCNNSRFLSTWNTVWSRNVSSMLFKYKTLQLPNPAEISYYIGQYWYNMNDIDFMMVLVAVLANMVQRIHLIGCYLENDRNAGWTWGGMKIWKNSEKSGPKIVWNFYISIVPYQNHIPEQFDNDNRWKNWLTQWKDVKSCRS